MIIVMVVLTLLVLAAAVALAIWVTDAYIVLAIAAVVALLAANGAIYFAWPDDSDKKTETVAQISCDTVTAPTGYHCEVSNGKINIVKDETAPPNDPCANITIPAGYKCENGNVIPDGSTQGTSGSQQLQPTTVAQLSDFCTIGGKQIALSYGTNRIYIDDATNASLKTSGGHCEVDLGSSQTFTYNSVEGKISIDGSRAPNGNNKVGTGQKFVVDYTAGDVSNGFDLKF